ncbi:MAG: hypothetical protein KA972_07445 [Brachymonas sp.]|nr:hypothetical protein [Brachymonas sp.]
MKIDLSINGQRVSLGLHDVDNLMRALAFSMSGAGAARTFGGVEVHSVADSPGGLARGAGGEATMRFSEAEPLSQRVRRTLGMSAAAPAEADPAQGYTLTDY